MLHFVRQFHKLAILYEYIDFVDEHFVVDDELIIHPMDVTMIEFQVYNFVYLIIEDKKKQEIESKHKNKIFNYLPNGK